MNPKDVLELNQFEIKMLDNLKKYLRKLKIDDVKLKAVREIARNSLFNILITRNMMEARKDETIPIDKYLRGAFKESMIKDALSSLITLKQKLKLEDDILIKSIAILNSFED
jgi:hypothetical protein